MTDRYENIRMALAMGPTPGPRRAVEQSVIGPQDLRILFAKVTFSVGINGSHSVPIEEAIANATLAAACDPDTIRALLAERDALAAALEAAQQRIACLPADWREDSSLETWFPLTAKQLAALQAENERLREALKDADNEMDWLDEDMDRCDHSVGVCTCSYWSVRRKMKAALAL